MDNYKIWHLKQLKILSDILHARQWLTENLPGFIKRFKNWKSDTYISESSIVKERLVLTLHFLLMEILVFWYNKQRTPTKTRLALVRPRDCRAKGRRLREAGLHCTSSASRNCFAQCVQALRNNWNALFLSHNFCVFSIVGTIVFLFSYEILTKPTLTL